MDSFNEYLNKKKDQAEYTTSYSLDEGLWDNIKKKATNASHGIQNAMNGIGRANRVSTYAVSVKFSSDDLIKKIIKSAEEKAKTTGVRVNYKDEIKKTATTIAKAMFLTAGGKVEREGWKTEPNCRKDFQYITVDKDKIVAYFKASAKEEASEKKMVDAAAQSFKRQLVDNVVKGLPHIPESSIKIEKTTDSKGHSKFMNQLKRPWDKVKGDLEHGIDIMADSLDKNMDKIQKELDRKADLAARDDELGEDINVYYLRWIVKPEKLNSILFNDSTTLKKANPDPDKVSETFCKYVNDKLEEKGLVKYHGMKYSLTTKNGYIGLQTTPTSIRFYFKDKSEAERIHHDLADEFGTVSSVASAKRPENSTKAFIPALTTDNFKKRSLYLETIMPTLRKGQKFVSVNVVFSNDQKEEFQKFLDAKDEVKDAEITKFLKEFISIAQKTLKGDFLGMGADEDTLYAYCTSKSKANTLMGEYGGHSINARLGSSEIVLDQEALTEIAKVKTITDFDNTKQFTRLQETIKKIVKSGICNTKTVGAISFSVSDAMIKAFNGKDNTDAKIDVIKDNFEKYMDSTILDKIESDSDYKDAFLGPYIDGTNVYLTFKPEAEGIVDEIYKSLIKNKGIEGNIAKVSLSKSVVERIMKRQAKDAALNYIKENDEAFIDACVDSVKEIADANATHNVIEVQLNEELYKKYAEEIDSDDDNKILKAITSKVKNALEKLGDACTAFYILNDTFTFILNNDDHAADHMENQLNSLFSGAKIATNNEVYSDSQYTRFTKFKDGILSTDNVSDAENMIKAIKAQGNIIKKEKEANTLKKYVVFAPIKGMADAKAIDGESDAFKVVQDMLHQTLAEVLKYPGNNDAEHSNEKNKNFIGFYGCMYKNTPCIAYVFNASEADHADWYKQIIAARSNNNTVSDEKLFSIPQFELDYIKKTAEDVPSVSDEHIKLLIKDIKTFTDKNKAAKEEAERKVVVAEVAVNDEAWGKALAGDNTQFSENNVAEEILKTIKETINKLKEKFGEAFIGFIPTDNTIRFIFKDTPEFSESYNIINNYMPHTKFVGANKQFKLDITAEYTTEFQNGLKNQLDRDLSIEVLGNLCKKIADVAKTQTTTNSNGFKWSALLNFAGMANKTLGDLLKIVNGQLVFAKLLDHKVNESVKQTFQHSLTDYLLNLLTEKDESAETTDKSKKQTKKVDVNTILPDTHFDLKQLNVENIDNIETDIKDEPDNVLNILHSDQFKIEKLGPAAKNQFLKAWSDQFIAEGKTINVAVTCESHNDDTINIAFTGEAENCAKFSEHLHKIEANSVGLFKIENEVNPEK